MQADVMVLRYAAQRTGSGRDIRIGIRKAETQTW